MMLGICPLWVYAQSRLDSIQHLDEITVVAKSFREVIPSQKLSGKELQKLNSHSVADALRYFSGVQLKDYGGVGGIKTVNIRSMGTNHMGVFLRWNRIEQRSERQVDLGMYSLDNIEEISLYNGQKSEIFQSAKDFGAAGTLYLRSRRPKFEDGKNTNLRATMKAGSFDVINPSALFEYKISENVAASFSAEWLNASGKYKFRYRRVNPAGEIAYDTTAVRKTGISTQPAWKRDCMEQSKEEPGTQKFIIIILNVVSPALLSITCGVAENGCGIPIPFFRALFVKEVNDQFKTQVNAKYAFYRTHYVNNDDKLIEVDNLYKQREVYVSTANMYTIFPFRDVSMSYDFQWNEMKADMYGFVFPHPFYQPAVDRNGSPPGKSKVAGKRFGDVCERPGQRRASPPKPGKYLLPAVFLSYKLFDKHDFSLRAFYKKTFRMPTFNDLYYADMGNSSWIPNMSRNII